MPPTTRRWRFPVASECAAHARHVSAAHARCVGADSHDVALAVSEAFTNAVLHAYPGTTSGHDVELTMTRCSTRLRVCVLDDGQGMIASAAAQASPGLGLGLGVIKQLTSSLDVEERPGGGTELRMYFPITYPGE